MNYSKETNSLLRKRLRKQKRKTFILFIFGLLIGTSATYAVYYWYPILKKEFDLPELRQIIKTTESSKSIKPETSESSQTTESTTMSENIFIPRIDIQSFVKPIPSHEKLAKNIDQLINGSNTKGTFLVVKNNQVVTYNNYGNETEKISDPIESTYMLGSVQKLITSVLLAKLIEDNEISLDTPLSTYYPNIPNSQSITIDQMLSMTSGLILEQKMENSKSKEESINYAIKNIQYQPQTSWHYSDVNFFLIATIIEKITKMPYEDFFNKTLKEPLGLKHTGFYNEVTTNTHLMPSYYRNDNGEIKKEAVRISESNYINELGTGNLFTTPADLLTMIHATLDGNIISYTTIQDILEKKPAEYAYDYKAGTYDKGNYFYSHGIFRGYDTIVFFSKDGSNATIFFSNSYTKDKSNIDLAKNIFTLVNSQNY